MYSGFSLSQLRKGPRKKDEHRERDIAETVHKGTETLLRDNRDVKLVAIQTTLFFKKYKAQMPRNLRTISDSNT